MGTEKLLLLNPEASVAASAAAAEEAMGGEGPEAAPASAEVPEREVVAGAARALAAVGKAQSTNKAGRRGTRMSVARAA